MKFTKTSIAKLKPGTKPYEVADSSLPGFRMRIQPTGVMTYYFVYRNGEGKSMRYRIGRTSQVTPAQARDLAVKRAAEVTAGIDVQAEKKIKREKAALDAVDTLGGFIELRYGPWVTAERRTGTATLKRLQAQFGFLMGKRMVEVTRWEIDLWRKRRTKAGRAASTINRDVVALKAVLSTAIEWDVLDVHPLAKLKPKRVDNAARVRYLTDAEETQLREAMTAREAEIRKGRESHNLWRKERGYTSLPAMGTHFSDYLQPMVLIALNTGMRRGELFNLQWQDVDGANITIEGATTKSGKTRHIPLNEEATRVFAAWGVKKTGYVFPNDSGGRLTSIKHSWSTLRAKAGLVDFRFHDLRHSFASKLVMAGVDLNVVRELLGHGSMEMTLRYAHLAPERKAAAVAKLVAPQVASIPEVFAGKR